MIFTSTKNASFLGYTERQFSSWMFSLDKWDLYMSAITLQTQNLHGFRWALIKFKEIIACVNYAKLMLAAVAVEPLAIANSPSDIGSRMP